MATKPPKIQAMEARNNYNNNWEVDLKSACCKDPTCCCISALCPTCASYVLRKRALRGDMKQYLCCNGYLPCSGKMQEQSCPELCLACEVCCCFATSVAVTRFMIQDELGVQNTKCDNCLIATMIVLQQLACICQIIACISGSEEIGQLADLISCLADFMYCSVCACMQTQHKIQLEERDSNPARINPMMPPHQQVMSAGEWTQPQLLPPPSYGYPIQQQQQYGKLPPPAQYQYNAPAPAYGGSTAPYQYQYPPPPPGQYVAQHPPKY
eukprot:TRINITY_DN34265_c0_g1_i1.p1 TRINITY_DN34265_c0_g1~~TRINITY_DN34265_c0_g1_i1.p1  ORF type:complete len:285 (+),score=20.67 TRINITY_DN34265_c0_g1_i1:54-857(+)